MGLIKGLVDHVFSLKNLSIDNGESPEEFLDRIRTQVTDLNKYIDVKENKQCELCESRILIDCVIWYLLGIDDDLRAIIEDQTSDFIDMTPSIILDEIITSSMSNWKPEVKKEIGVDPIDSYGEDDENDQNVDYKSEDPDYDPLISNGEDDQDDDFDEFEVSISKEITNEDLILASENEQKYEDNIVSIKMNDLKPVINNDGVYQCYVCEKPYTAKYALLQHISIHYTESTFCAHCEQPSTFGDNHKCKENILESEKNKLIVKKRDPDEMKVMSDIIKSLPKLENETKKKFIAKNNSKAPTKSRLCKFCNKDFDQDLDALNEHLEAEHKGQTKYKCEHCEKEFTTRKRQIIHLEVKHGVIIRTNRMKDFYYCTKCRIAFKTRSERIAHHDKVHRLRGGKEELLCRYCAKVFSHKRSLKLHEWSHTNEGKPQRKNKKCICSYCSKEFNSSYQLASHEITHTKNYRFYCKFCGRGFASKSHIDKHERICLRGKSYQCSHCDEFFPNYIELFAHTKTHNLDNLEPKFQCKYCNEKLLTRNKLLAHRQKYHSQYIITFGCKSCPDKTYNNRTNAVQHVIANHSDLTPYQCQVCGIFKNFCNGLRQHIKINHKDAPLKDKAVKFHKTPEYEAVLEKFLLINKEERKESSYLNYTNS